MKHLSIPNAAVRRAAASTFPGSDRQIEFVGPPGVGKSALYQLLHARLEFRKCYRTVQEGRLLAALASLKSFGLLRRMSYRSAFKLPRIGEVYARRLAAASAEAAFRQALHAHPVFLECCIDLALTGFGDAFARFARLPIMLDHLRDLHLWSYLPASTRILQQDALVQKGWACAPQSQEIYFSSLPKPDAVVVLQAAPGIIVERLRSRPRRINAHLGLSDCDLHTASIKATEAFELAAAILRSRNVPVFVVNAEADLSYTADQVQSFLLSQVSHQEVR